MFHWTEDELPTASFSCGPGQGLVSVRTAQLCQTHFERSHRAADISYEGLYRDCTTRLRQLLQIPPDYKLIFFPGGATAAMDAVTWSLTKDTISGVDIGAFSHLWCHEIAGRLEPSVSRQWVHADAHFLPNGLPNTSASLVLLTPNETSTGVQLPDSYLKQVWDSRGPDTLVAWDVTSCAGGRDLPIAYDILLFGLQKCFGAGGGTCVLALSPRAWQRAQHPVRQIPYLLDLRNALSYTERFQTLNTPSTINIWMANKACQFMLEHGGITAMETLCKKHANYLVAWAQKSAFFKPLITNETYRSFTTLTLALTHPLLTGEKIAKVLFQTGKANLADGLKKYRTVHQESIRIACFPFVDPDGIGQYQKLTNMLDKIAQELTAGK